MAGYLGAESVYFGEGAVTTINGHEFYVYPMTMTSGGTNYTGKIYLGDSSKGCIVSCYATSELSSDKDAIAAVCESSVATLIY